MMFHLLLYTVVTINHTIYDFTPGLKKQSIGALLMALFINMALMAYRT